MQLNPKRKLIRVVDVPKHMPQGVRISAHTAWRWATIGLRGDKLATTVVAGRRYTTRRFIREFLERTAASAPSQLRPNPHSRGALATAAIDAGGMGRAVVGSQT